MYRRHRTLILVALLASLWAAPALADPIRVNFTVLADPADPVNSGSTASGNFTFDSDWIPFGGGQVTNPAGLNVSSISFSWDGHAWTTASADAYYLFFASDRTLTTWVLGGDLAGADFGTAGPDIFLSLTPTDSTFSYMIGANTYSAGAIVSWDVATLPFMVGAWQGGALHIAVDSFGRVYEYSEPYLGQLGTVTMRGNLFGGPPPSPVVTMAPGSAGVWATLQNGDVWLLRHVMTTGEFVGNIFSAPGIAAVGHSPPPSRNALSPNRPNPFNPATRVPYTLASSGHVSIKIFDAAGRLVRTVEDGRKPSGSYTATWSGETDNGTKAGSGTYFLKITYPDGTGSEQKLTVLK